MAWRIVSWDPVSETGLVQSPHIGPLSFNRVCTREAEFSPGETVRVELGGENDDCFVLYVARLPTRRTDPLEGPFADLNSHELEDSLLERDSASDVAVWVGDCCRRCDPGFVVRFLNVSYMVCSAESWRQPLFRMASSQEVAAQKCTVPATSQAYVIESNDVDESGTAFIVAGDARIAPGQPPHPEKG